MFLPAASLATLIFLGQVGGLVKPVPQVPSGPLKQVKGYANRPQMVDRFRELLQHVGQADSRRLWHINIDTIFQARTLHEGDLPWKNIGPAPLARAEYNAAGGEALDLAIDPRGSADQIMYAATNAGGLWKSVDAGVSWVPMTDFMPSLSTSAVVLDVMDPNTVYVGTGSRFDGCGVFSKCVGIYKSIDAGATWTTLGGDVFSSAPGASGPFIIRMATTAPHVLYVATDRGLFRSPDGGVSFTMVKSGFITDLATGTRGAEIYAAVAGEGLFRSFDGISFRNLFTPTNHAPTGFFELNFAQSTFPNSNTLYTAFDVDGHYGGMAQSIDNGANWTVTSGPDLGVGLSHNHTNDDIYEQGYYDNQVGVDPHNARRVYLGLLNIHASNDGGRTFPETLSSGIHSDNHRLVTSPISHLAAATTAPAAPVYACTDGGLFGSHDLGRHFGAMNGGICAFLTTQIGGGRSDPRRIYANFWDHGGAFKSNEMPGNRWQSVQSGDGGFTGADPIDSNRATLGGNYNPTFTTTGGLIWLSWLISGVDLISYGHTRRNTTHTYEAWDRVLKRDGADLPRLRSSIRSIATTPFNDRLVVVGLADGSVWELYAPSTTWVRIRESFPRLPATVAIDSNNDKRIFVGFSGFTDVVNVHPTLHAFITNDGGAHWSGASGVEGHAETNLPDLPVYCASFDESTTPSRIVIGTEGGVFISHDDGQQWRLLGTQLPTVPVLSLQYYTPRGEAGVYPPMTKALLRIGTWGRGVWEIEL